jgi:hypothetical protein
MESFLDVEDAREGIGEENTDATGAPALTSGADEWRLSGPLSAP